MRAAQIEDGKVVNIIEAESLDIWPGVILVEAGSASIGDTWDGTSFSAPYVPPLPPDLSETDTTWDDEV